MINDAINQRVSKTKYGTDDDNGIHKKNTYKNGKKQYKV
jgi:hypothetical protein